MSCSDTGQNAQQLQEHKAEKEDEVGAAMANGGRPPASAGKTTWKFMRSNSLPVAVSANGGDGPTSRPWWENVSRFFCSQPELFAP